MADYLLPVPQVYNFNPLGGKDPFLSLNDHNFHANISFFVGYDIVNVAPVQLREGVWTGVPLSKNVFKLSEFSITKNTFLVFRSPAGAYITMSIIATSPLQGFLSWLSIGIGSKNCTTVTVPAVYALDPFYECNYLNTELFINSTNQYNRLAPEYIVTSNTTENFLNCAITFSRINGFLINFDMTNWRAQVLLDYTNYLEANSTLEGIYEFYHIHINGVYQE